MEKKLLFVAVFILVVVWSLWYFKVPPFNGSVSSNTKTPEQMIGDDKATGKDAAPAEVGEEIPANTVIINEGTFFPQTVIIPKGSSVAFINRDSSEHSATATNKSFDTGLLKKDGQKTITFDSSGTFAYSCTKHPTMQGVIVVQK